MAQSEYLVPEGEVVLAYLRRSTRKPKYEAGHSVLVPYSVMLKSKKFNCWYEGKVTRASALHRCFDVYIQACDEVVLNVMEQKLVDMNRFDEQHLLRLKTIITGNQAYIDKANETDLVPYEKGLYLG